MTFLLPPGIKGFNIVLEWWQNLLANTCVSVKVWISLIENFYGGAHYILAVYLQPKNLWFPLYKKLNIFRETWNYLLKIQSCKENFLNTSALPSLKSGVAAQAQIRLPLIPFTIYWSSFTSEKSTPSIFSTS